MRHVLIDGDPWFVAMDACRCLGLNTTKGTHQHLRKLPDDERLTVRKGQNGPVSDTGAIFAGMENLHVLISEQGIYRLTMRSDKPMAKAMQDWVTREVLPSIRKTGGYLLNEEARETAAVSPSMPTSFADALRRYADELDMRIPTIAISHSNMMAISIPR